MTTRAMTALALLALAGPAAAAPVQVDFNVAGYGPAPGTVQAHTRHEAAVGADFTFAALDQSLAPAGTLWWDAGSDDGFKDGFGVVGSGYSNDEVEGGERLALRFSRPVDLLGFGLTDLFTEAEPGRPPCPGPGCYSEWGAAMYEYADGTRSLWQAFSAPTSNTRTGNGVLDVAVNQQGVVGIVFAAPGEVFGNVPRGFRELHEFSLARVVVDDGQPPAVPEPGSLALLGTGLVLGARAWRRKALATTESAGV
jgi:hypothetical protein